MGSGWPAGHYTVARIAGEIRGFHVVGCERVSPACEGARMLKRIGSWVVAGVAVVWAALTFFASNSPADVQQKAGGWLALPVIRELPDKLLGFAGHPAVLAITFFLLGGFAGWWLAKRRSKQDSYPWYEVLGVEMSLLASGITNSRWHSDIHRLNADIDVVRVKAEKKGLRFPKFSDGFNSLQSLLPYLNKVSAHLQAGHIAQAREAARQLSASPNP